MKYHENYYDDPQDYEQLTCEDDHGDPALIETKTPIRKIIERLYLWERSHIILNTCYFPSKEYDWTLECEKKKCKDCEVKDCCGEYESYMKDVVEGRATEKEAREDGMIE